MGLIRHLGFIIFFFGFLNVSGQTYVGAGIHNGITVSSSSNHQDHRWSETAAAVNTLNGSGMDDARFEAARFLQQATIGFTQSHIDDVISLGKETWIENQFSLPESKVLDQLNVVFATIIDSLEKYNESIPRRPNWKHFSYAWWQVNMINEDLLRHKVACALAEILVVSRNSDLSGYGDALASYYDVLLGHAFGNYRDLLFDVSLHPTMGYYLSHANNPKSDTLIGRFPDENYARELKQLMTIGLFELNTDGSRKQLNGTDIPTYDNDDIIEYAKIFTGLSYGAIHPASNKTLKFGLNKYEADMTVPMIMYDVDDPATNRIDEDQHEDGIKTLLGGVIVPAGQSGMQDINDAVDNLFNHPNVGPFIAYRLIQRLAKSNPTPAYIQRVAQVFNDDGQGVRGNMQALIKAILMDVEAQSCNYRTIDDHSRLKEPMFRYTQFVRAVDKTAPSSFYWNDGKGFSNDAGQEILASPSVFNFFLPNDAPNGEIEDRGLVAPEFRLHDTKFSVGYINEVLEWTYNGRLMRISEKNFTHNIEWNIDSLLVIAEDIEAFINWIDLNITHGRLSDMTRSLIRDALLKYSAAGSSYLENRVRMGMYIALISPDYNIFE